MMVRAFLLLVISGSHAVAATPCAPYAGAIALDFETLRPEVSIDNTRNVTAIRDLIRSDGEPGLDAHADPLGLTSTRPILSLEAETRIESQDGTICVYLERVNARFGFRSMQVHVASEYPPGSCEYKAILDHENQHVGISRSALDTHAGLMRLELERILSEEKPLASREPQRATHDIVDDLQKRMGPALSAFYEEIDSRNAAIDSRSNYNAIAAICKDWARGNRWPPKSD